MNFHSLRTTLRTWRRNRKKLKRLGQSEVILLRFPKSGVTWLRVMITNVYRKRLGIEGTEIVGRSAFHSAEKGVPHLFVSMDNFCLRSELERRLAGKKVILLLRDPRDIAISRYFSQLKRATQIERSVLGVPDSIEAEGPFRFAVHPAYGMPRIIDFMNYWFEAIGRHPSALIVRYEDLRQDAQIAFTPVMRFLLPDVTADEIEAAVAASSFERMKQMEAAGSFGLDILKPRINDDSDSFKVRRGEVGGYAQYLSQDEKTILDKLVSDTLNRNIGYA